jgi:hypothetical protein
MFLWIEPAALGLAPGQQNEPGDRLTIARDDQLVLRLEQALGGRPALSEIPDRDRLYR